MATVLLVRHGRTTANASGVLAGRTPGVLLDDVGQSQAEATATRLKALPLAGIITSPMERCVQTAEALLSSRPEFTQVVDERLTECGYGSWQGRPLAELAKEELWKVVQRHPSAAHFPDGESLLDMQSRAVAAIREHDASFGDDDVWVAVSHGDVIKSILTDALGLHLDLFQRIHVHPASVSIIKYGKHRPDVLAMNTSAGDLSWLAAARDADAPVGGGAGPSTNS